MSWSSELARSNLESKGVLGPPGPAWSMSRPNKSRTHRDRDPFALVSWVGDLLGSGLHYIYAVSFKLNWKDIFLGVKNYIEFS